ncbi:MAG: ketopantoate reductase family protein [Ignavibacteria bacterium]
MPIGKKNILITGLGAVGGYFGTFLALNKNNNVCFLSRGDTCKHFKSYRLILKSYKGYELSFKPKVSDNTTTFKKKFDYVFVCTKSNDTASLIPQIQKVVTKNSQIISLQNGIYNYRLIKKTFGSARTLQLICKIGVEMDLKYTILHSSLGFIQAGEMSGKYSKRIKTMYSVLKESGIDVRIIKNIKEEIWIKYAWNTIFNSLTSIGSVTVDKLFRLKQTEELVENIYEEIKMIAKTQGILFDGIARRKVIEDSNKLGAFKTSSYQDRLKGKVLETPYFTGELLRLAAKKKIETPLLKAVHALSLAI